jgi:hypothetical protein
MIEANQKEPTSKRRSLCVKLARAGHFKWQVQRPVWPGNGATRTGIMAVGARLISATHADRQARRESWSSVKLDSPPFVCGWPMIALVVMVVVGYSIASAAWLSWSEMLTHSAWWCSATNWRPRSQW